VGSAGGGGAIIGYLIRAQKPRRERISCKGQVVMAGGRFLLTPADLGGCDHTSSSTSNCSAPVSRTCRGRVRLPRAEW